VGSFSSSRYSGGEGARSIALVIDSTSCRDSLRVVGALSSSRECSSRVSGGEQWFGSDDSFRKLPSLTRSVKVDDTCLL
jgi:hypothetical protein